MIRGGVWGGLLLVGLAVWVLPYTPARAWPIGSHLVAIDRIITLLLAGAAVAALILALTVWRRSGGRGRSLLIGVTCVLFALAGLFGARILAQGTAEGSDPGQNSGLRALAWNAAGEDNTAPADILMPVIKAYGVEILVLPETGWRTAEIAAEYLGERGFANVAYTDEGTATSVLLSPRLAAAGNYRVDTNMPPWAGLALRPETPSPETPIIVGTHLQQPSPGNIETWRMHLDWVAGLCAESPFVVVLGDMNSTLNNLGGDTVGVCRDVAAAHGAGATATWPTWLPSGLGVSLDRFLMGTGFDPERASVRVLREIQPERADHWPILVSF
ncbi:endonuclease/exonuclease/phosphatase family protein [Mycetocola tolaasinivorans]|uniref:Endonuclease/exonuclease/phosphatase family protein n=1 Tax=Mycetocola tolaasinivorans TaxID=76635 RepID=A0A3L7A4I2_9MICO|nr:endonuclease/exonuclease/phosphatase family protein [Mycetocola tolaasinivorans]